MFLHNGALLHRTKMARKELSGFGLCRPPVTWHLICGRACGESHTYTRNSGRLQVWLTCSITWFSALHLNAMNRSEDFCSHCLAWNVRPATALEGGGGVGGGGGGWIEMKRDKPRVLQFKQVLRAARPAEFIYIKICRISGKNVLISDNLDFFFYIHLMRKCDRVVNEVYLPCWTDFFEYDMLINSGRVLWIVFARL